MLQQTRGRVSSATRHHGRFPTLFAWLWRPRKSTRSMERVGYIGRPHLHKRGFCGDTFKALFRRPPSSCASFRHCAYTAAAIASIVTASRLRWLMASRARAVQVLGMGECQPRRSGHACRKVEELAARLVDPQRPATSTRRSWSLGRPCACPAIRSALFVRSHRLQDSGRA